MTEPKARFPILLTVFIAACLVILCGLGTWQVQRMGWKEGLIAQAEAAAWYWHFVDVVWLFLFAFVYVVFG